MVKISIDWANSIIDVLSGVTSIDVQSEIYSEWKRQKQQGDNAKWPQAMVSVGGDPLEPDPSSKFVPSFYFLLNGWKVRAPLGSDSIPLGENLFTDDGSDPFISGGSRSSFIATVDQGVTTVISGGAISPTDILAIAQGVWEENLASYLPNTAGHSVQTLYKIENNRWQITGNQLVVYDDDGTTPFRTFDLRNKLGNPTETEPFERIPV